MPVVKLTTFDKTTGQLRDLAAGETFTGGADSGIAAYTTAAAVLKGNVLYASAPGTVNKAQANSQTTTKPVGIAQAAAGSGTSVSVQTNGIVTFTTAEWDAITGQSGGLVFNTDYYLSVAAAGLLIPLSSVAAIAAGNFIVKVGRAISTVDLSFEPGQPYQVN